MYVDRCKRNSYIANVGGITLSELNMLEIITLHLLHYNLFVTGETYASYVGVSDKYLNAKREYHLRVLAPPNDVSITKSSMEVDQ